MNPSPRVRAVVLASLREMSQERSNAQSYKAIVPELSKTERDQMIMWLVQSIAEGLGIELSLPIGHDRTMGEALLTTLVTGIAVGREIERAV